MKHLLPFVCCLFLAVSCSKTIDNTGTCSDGIKNQGEQGVDCGGPCGNPCPSCGDGIMNQDETAVDCGGSCDPCYARLSATVNDTLWYATSRNAFISAPGTLRIYGTNQLQNMTLLYSGSLAAGTTPTGSQFTAEFRDEIGNLFSSKPGGSITFTTFDTTSRQVSGIFSCEVLNSQSGQTLSVEGGIITVISY